jgi:hypothetical protein
LFGNSRGLNLLIRESMHESPQPIAFPHMEFYSDGGCEPKPGPGGYGVVLLHSKKRAEVNGGFRLTLTSPLIPLPSRRERRGKLF